MNAPEKLPVDRRTFLGGSDAAAIVGVSPWKTQLDVYFSKRGETVGTGREADPALQDLLETGKEMEPVIVNRLIRRFGVKVTKRSLPEAPNRYADPEHPFLAAEIDFEWEVTKDVAERFGFPLELVGTIQNGEAKNVHMWATAQFGTEETEEVPMQYAAQASHGLMVTGRQLCLFAVQLGSNLGVYWIHRDEEIIKPLRQKEIAFWNNHVLAGVPPEPMDLADVYKLFRKVQPIQVEATEEILKACEDLERAKQEKSAAEDLEVECKFQIGKYMLGEAGIFLGKGGKLEPTLSTPTGVHQLMNEGVPLLKVALQTQQRLDGDRLKRDHPEIAAECAKTTQFFRFDKPRKKR